MTGQSSSSTALTEETPCLRKININKRLLPMKLHYFLFYGAVGSVIPYMTLIGKELGINATGVGLIYTILPFVVLFSKPIFGAITDHFRNLRFIMYLLVIVTAVTFFLVTLVQPIDTKANDKDEVTLKCLKESVIFRTPSNYDPKCVRTMISNGTECDLEFIGDFENSSYSGQPEGMNSESFIKSKRRLVELQIVSDSSYVVGTPRRLDIEFFKNSSFPEICNRSGVVYKVNCTPNLTSCSSGKDESFSKEVMYGSYQFWLFLILTVVSGTGSATVFCLSDAACMEILDEDTELYGRQRLWATISWGLSSFVAGYLNDLVSRAYSYTTYAPGFYLMLGLIFLDLFAVYHIAPKKSKFSANICKDVGRIFASCEIVCFGIAATVIGGLTALLWSYQFWYFQELGATSLLLGLNVAVQCVIAEVPFFFLSGYIIRTFGHFYCIVGSFGAFCLRYCLYFFLKDPWLSLPIEIFHGLTYATFYATMTSYAKTKAPAGTEATMIGVMGGLFEGLGLAIGNILSGIGFDYLTGRYTFLTAAVISGVFTVVFFIIRLILGKPK